MREDSSWLTAFMQSTLGSQAWLSHTLAHRDGSAQDSPLLGSTDYHAACAPSCSCATESLRHTACHPGQLRWAPAVYQPCTTAAHAQGGGVWGEMVSRWSRKRAYRVLLSIQRVTPPDWPCKRPSAGETLLVTNAPSNRAW